MATLFFEGFDKGIIFNQLDPNYWSTQFKQYPKYSFGGYLPDSAGYTYNSPNGGILPSIGYAYNINDYPGFGSPPGFIALTNIEIENNANVEYPTYLQCSGFAPPSGDISYLSMRCLGLESKSAAYSDYPYRHTLFSYNSGDIAQLTINVVKITGTNNFVPINTKYETLALEIQQNNQTIGYFDLNINISLSNFKISSVYDTNNTILTITKSQPSNVSRWAHLEFSVDQSDSQQPLLYINAEDINLPVVNFNQDISKEDWEISLPISGFKFDNLRFYNRTYSSSIINGSSWGPSNYYMVSKVWLLDDLVLIDNSGLDPKYWLGSTARVIQLAPGVNGSPDGYTDGRQIDDFGIVDGIKDWTTNSTIRYQLSQYPYPWVTPPSHRKALYYLDNDANSIEAINSGSLDAVVYTPRPIGGYYDENSRWRENLNDSVGGIKIYNSARKKYLDTKFVNVFRSGIGDPLESSVSLLLHGNVDQIVDSTKIPKTVTNNNVMVRGDNTKFGDGSLYFSDNNSYLSINHSDLANNPFTIECWIYFKNNNQKINLFSKLLDNQCPQRTDFATFYNFYTNTSGITLVRSGNCDKTLLFNSAAQTGVWNHIAIVRTSGDDLKCFLNGVVGTRYNISNCENRLCPNVDSYNLGLGFFKEDQGTFDGIYSLNFLNNKNLVSYEHRIAANNYFVYPTLKVGQSQASLTYDQYFNNVSLLIKSDQSSIIDLSSNSKTINNSGVIFSYDHSRFGDKSLYFTGGKTLSFANSNDFNFGTDDFTINFWFYINNTTSSNIYKLLNSSSLNMKTVNNNGSPYIQLYILDSNGVAYGFHASNGNYGMGISLNTWYHTSIVKYRGDIFAYIIPINQIFTPNTTWPLYIIRSESVLNPISGGYNTYNNFDINLNGFTIGDTNSSLTHNLYVDNLRVTKGVARITTRLLSPISSPEESFGTSLPVDNTDNGIYIDDYRITYGVSRYNSNFAVPTEPFKTERDDYYPVGPEYNVSKTFYKTFQHYSMKNPVTNQNWTVPQISGMLLGVKKL